MARIVYNSISQGQIDSFALSAGYQSSIATPSGSIPNPESKLGFMERKGREYFEGQCAYGKRLEREAARRAQDIADAATIVLSSGTITE